MRLALASSIGLAGAAFASPAGAVTVWQGVATVTDASPACQSSVSERLSVDIGTNFRTVLRPKGVSDNGEDTRVSFVHDGQANFVIFTPNGAPSGTYAAFGANYNGTIVANRTGAYRKLAIVPKAPKATTPFLTYSGTIQDFMFIEGCTVDFTAAYGLRS